jgi:hypothetical protein
VAAKAREADVDLLSGLANHAHKLMLELVGLSCEQNDRASELLAELEHVIAEFKRLRPPPTFKGARGLRLVPGDESRPCVVCQQAIDLGKRNYIESEDQVYHRSCYDLSRSD